MEPEPAVELPPSKKKRVVTRAARAGLALYDSRDALLKTLERLRERGALTPADEAKTFAIWQEGGAQLKKRVASLVKQLDESYQLTQSAKGRADDLTRQAASLAAQARKILDEGDFKRDAQAALDMGRLERQRLASEGKEALAYAKQEGSLIFQQYKGELQQFLDRNKPAVDAVERATTQLSGAARELAGSLKYAGKEAAQELWTRGKQVLVEADTEAWEQAAIDWSADTVPKVERALQSLMVWAGVFFFAIGALFASSLYPPVQPYALALAALVSLAMAFAVLAQSFKMRRLASETQARLERLAAMPSSQRRELFREKWKRQQEDAEAPPPPSQ